MENNKYYTPDISEYHIGFEYQSLTDPRQPEKDIAWSDEELRTEVDMMNVFKYMIEDDFMEHRCKFLDKEDIESFGFIHDRSYMFNLGQYRLHFIQPDNELDIIHIYDNESNDDTIFLGNIKNKSEFKFILKRLGICQ